MSSSSVGAMEEIVSSVQYMFAGAAILATLLVFVMAVWCWRTGRFDNDDSAETTTTVRWTDTLLRREQLESVDDVNDPNRDAWRCAVCAYINTERARGCLMCGTSKQFVVDSNVNGANVTDQNDGDDVDAGNALRQRQQALLRRHMHAMAARRELSQRQRGAFRRRLWMRHKMADGQMRWMRMSSCNEDDAGCYELMTDSKPEGELPTRSGGSQNEVLVNARVQSQGFVSQYDEQGLLQWKHAEDVAIDMSSFENLTNELTEATDEHLDLERVTALEFRPKKQWFLVRLSRLATPAFEVVTKLSIERNNLLEDSMIALTTCPLEVLRTYLRISFPGEPGVDAGGLLREWFTQLSKIIFCSELGLFVSTKGESTSYWINPLSGKRTPRHLEYFRFAGILVGKALFEGLVMDAHLALPLLKHVLGIPISFSDLEFLDEELYRNCQYLLHNTNVETLCLTFSVMLEDGQEIDLKDNGRNIDVTDDNKIEYLQLVLQHRMLGSIAEQLQHFLTGLYDVVPKSLLSVFDYQELELMLCGVPTIDVEDWRRHTNIAFLNVQSSSGNDSYSSRSHQEQIIQWFWAFVTRLSDEERARLLQFATGTSRLPVEGFRGLTSSSGIIHLFTIQFVLRGNDRTELFPKAHTCFNRIELPMYRSAEELETFVSSVLEMEILGFGLE